MAQPRRARGEAGETLAEIMVTIAIIGLAVVALVGALATGISASSQHRGQSSADTIARSVAEALKDRQVPLDPNGAYGPAIWASTVDTTGYNVTVAATCLKTSDTSTSTVTDANFATCSGSTTGLQMITVDVAATSGKAQTESVTILKRTS